MPHQNMKDTGWPAERRQCKLHTACGADSTCGNMVKRSHQIHKQHSHDPLGGMETAVIAKKPPTHPATPAP